MPFVTTIKAWVRISRPPFILVGILPFVVGTVMSLWLTGVVNVPVFLWGMIAVVCVLLATYYNGELHDIEEDRLSRKLEKNFFSAGTQVLVEGLISPGMVNAASFVLIAAAFAIALLLQFHYQTGPWTLPLGITGMITGFYYSKPPLRWVKRGVGEFLIAYSYGWLPVVGAFYLQTGHFHPLAHGVSLPIACSVFNVILVNEFPDRPADIQVGKRNLVVRFGKERCAALYAAVGVAGPAAFVMSLTRGVPAAAGFFYIPVGILSLAAAFLMLTGKFNDRPFLEKICLMTILVNLGTSFVYIAGFWGMK